MLNHICLKNFKAFGPKAQKAEFKKINLIVGENSAGKSSIIHALCLLKQSISINSTEALIPRFTQGNELGLVNLGSYEDLCYGRNKKNNVTFEVGFTQQHAYATERSSAKKSATPVSYSITFKEDKSGSILPRKIKFGSPTRPQLLDFTIEFLKSDSRVKLSAGSQRRRSAFLEAVLKSMGSANKRIKTLNQMQEEAKVLRNKAESLHEELAALKDKKSDFLALIKKEEFKDLQMRTDEFKKAIEEFGKLVKLEESGEYLQLGDGEFAKLIARAMRVLDDANVKVNNFVCTFEYNRNFSRARGEGISPVFSEVESQLRLMNASAHQLRKMLYSSMSNVGPYRLPPDRYTVTTNMPHETVGYEGQFSAQILQRLHSREPKSFKSLNQVLKNLGLPVSLHVKEHSGDDLFSVGFVSPDGRFDSVRDVGFGFSQFLPIILQCCLAKNQIITIEQPELHVHPKLQADLGEQIARTAIQRGNQVLIETHSEHVILRMKKLVRDGELDPNDVNIVHVSPGTTGSVITNIGLDNDGEFTNEWPGGFFRERAQEIL